MGGMIKAHHHHLVSEVFGSSWIDCKAEVALQLNDDDTWAKNYVDQCLGNSAQELLMGWLGRCLRIRCE